MAKRTMNKGLAALALALTTLSGCHPAAQEEAPLAGAAIGGPFRLVDQDGQPFDSSRLLGRYAIVYFGYTFCPDVCPTDMQVLAKGLARLKSSDPGKAAKIVPLFITVDPARDTPAVLKQFVANFPPLTGLTGTPDQIAKVAKEYAVFYRKVPPKPGASGYLVNHSSQAVLFGPDGKPIALVPVGADAGQVADTLEKWVK